MAYPAAVAFVALAALGLWLLQPILGNSVPLTVFLVAWVRGCSPPSSR
jgi:hypothetical protein